MAKVLRVMFGGKMLGARRDLCRLERAVMKSSRILGGEKGDKFIPVWKLHLAIAIRTIEHARHHTRTAILLHLLERQSCVKCGCCVFVDMDAIFVSILFDIARSREDGVEAVETAESPRIAIASFSRHQIGPVQRGLSTSFHLPSSAAVVISFCYRAFRKTNAL